MSANVPPPATFSEEAIFIEECQRIGLPSTNDAVGLALSGGGVRAATFALGVLQGMAQEIEPKAACLLDTVDYLSSVSGGGYIASWFSQQITKRGYSLTRQALRAPADTSVALVRNYGSYLTPQRGFFSTDTWRMVAGYLVRLVPNALLISSALSSLILLPYLIRNWASWVADGHSSSSFLSIWTWLPFLLLFGHAVGSFAPGIPDKLRAWGSFLLIAAFVAGIPMAVWIARHSHRWAWTLSIAGGSQAMLAIFGWLRLREAEYKLRLTGAWVASTALGWAMISVSLAAIRWLWGAGMVEVAIAVAPTLFSLIYLAICAAWTYCVPFDDDDQEFINSLWGTTASMALGWALVTTVCCVAPHYLTPYLVKFGKPDWQAKLSATLASIGAIAASLVSVFYDDSKGSATPAMSERIRQKRQAASSRLRSVIATAAPYLVLTSMLVLAALLGPTILRKLETAYPGTRIPTFECIAAVGCAVAAIIIGWAMDVNRLSMKNFYRSRLTTAYLEDCAVLLSDVRNMDHDANTSEPNRPYPIINCAMNVTSAKDLSVQSIRSRNFIFSPLFCGFHAHSESGQKATSGQGELEPGGYRRTTEYLSDLPPRVRLKEETQPTAGIRLNDPMTISGAAANPAMGFHTSPALSFLLAMFNVRLGAWVGNPRHLTAYRKTASSGAPGLLIADFLGRTGDESEFLMLSDGGHFENTAAYELIRRKCRLIFCCDSGCDSEYVFGDLLHLVERCQIDFGVTITIPEMYHLRPFGRTGYARSNFTIGTIRYPDSPSGYLVIFKPTVTRDACETIKSFDRDNTSFPQVSTADQWFYESEFEAYRLLGMEAVSAFVKELDLGGKLTSGQKSAHQMVSERVADLAQAVIQ